MGRPKRHTQNTLTLESTIRELRDYNREAAYDTGGTTCEGCMQHVEVYYRKLNYPMGRDLFEVVKKYGLDFFNLPTALPNKINMEFTKLQHWDMIIAAAPKSTNPKTAGRGWWSVTPKGVAFASGNLCVPEHVYVYNGRTLAPETGKRWVTIADLGPFDYNDLRGFTDKEDE